MPVCPVCKSEYEEGARICAACAETVSGVSFCTLHKDYSFFNNWAVVYAA